jgi:hypothetical protein
MRGSFGKRGRAAGGAGGPGRQGLRAAGSTAGIKLVPVEEQMLLRWLERRVVDVLGPWRAGEQG